MGPPTLLSANTTSPLFRVKLLLSCFKRACPCNPASSTLDRCCFTPYNREAPGFACPPSTSKEPETMADRVGQQFSNYRLVSLLGQGGYAEVYLGQHVRLELQAAIKVLHAYLTGGEAEHFQQEAQTIARLAHPSIVRVFDFDVQDGMPFLVMDYAPNGSVRRRYPKGSVVPLPLIVSLVKQVAA